ncbi:MAG: hypothetical protein EOO42_01305 [Flavobacteriales bacterium]|nr:MAG: hypothetical protein EOO42_01305 [Flavobacteriales bacterium]
MPRRKHVDIKLEGIAGELGAKVYNESPGFTCLLDEDIHESVVGRGASVVDAVNNWDAKLQSHLRNASQDDPVVLLVKKHLTKTSYTEPIRRTGKPTWTDENKPSHVIEWENQFRPIVRRK